MLDINKNLMKKNNIKQCLGLIKMFIELLSGLTTRNFGESLWH